MYENVIDELAELFDVSRQAAKVRLIDLGYSKAEGAYPFVDGQYVRGYSFEPGALDKNQTFTIPYADLFKAYCFDREFKKLADASLVGEKTIQRLRNDEEYPTFVQTVLGLCVGLKLPSPEAEMFLSKTDFKFEIKAIDTDALAEYQDD